MGGPSAARAGAEAKGRRTPPRVPRAHSDLPDHRVHYTPGLADRPGGFSCLSLFRRLGESEIARYPNLRPAHRNEGTSLPPIRRDRRDRPGGRGV